MKILRLLQILSTRRKLNNMPHQPPSAPAMGPPDTMPIALTLDAWVADSRHRRALTEPHFRKQRRDVERCCEFNRWTVLEQMTLGGAEAFMVSLREQGRKGRTHDRIVSSLRRFGDFVRRRGYIKHDPFGDLQRLGRKAITERGRGTRPLTGDELERMVAVAMEQEMNDGRAQLARTCRRSRVYLVARWTGYRREECKRLRWPMVHDLWGKRPAIEVVGKNGQIEYLALHADAVEVLQEQWEESNGDPRGRVFPVLPKPHTVDMDMWRAGIIHRDESGQFHKADDRGFIVGFHSLRKTLNREMRRGGVDAGLRRRIMRHQSEALTDFEYDMADYAELKDAVEKCPSVLRRVRESLGQTPGGGDVDNADQRPPPEGFFSSSLARSRSGRYREGDHTSHDAPASHHDDEGRRRVGAAGWCGNPDARRFAGPRDREPQPRPTMHAHGAGSVRQMRSGVRVPLPPLPKASGVPAAAGAPDLKVLADLLSELLRVLKGTEHDAPTARPPVRPAPQPPEDLDAPGPT